MGVSLPNIVIVTTPTRMQGWSHAVGDEGAAGSGSSRPLRIGHNAAETADAVTLAEADFDLYETENSAIRADDRAVAG